MRRKGKWSFYQTGVWMNEITKLKHYWYVNHRTWVQEWWKGCYFPKNDLNADTQTHQNNSYYLLEDDIPIFLSEPCNKLIFTLNQQMMRRSPENSRLSRCYKNLDYHHLLDLEISLIYRKYKGRITIPNTNFNSKHFCHLTTKYTNFLDNYFLFRD